MPGERIINSCTSPSIKECSYAISTSIIPHYLCTMITYNPRHWIGILSLHKADTMRQLLPLMLFLCVYTFAINFIEITWLHLQPGSHLSNVTLMHGLLGFAISMLLVFRTNTAYDRWWEGRKLWGSLINNTRNLAIKLDTFLPADTAKDRAFFAKLLPLFAHLLSKHLQNEITRLELDEHRHPELPGFDVNRHVPGQVVKLLWQRISHLYDHKKITGEHLIILNAEVQSLLDVCGACERIKNTPIPYSYSAFIKKFIFFYVVTLPFGYIFTLGYLAIPVVAFVFYILASLELIAEEIEDPFGPDENDLPMQRMVATIQKNVQEIFG